MAWTEDKRKEVIAEYVDIMENQFKDAAERASASIEVVKQLATKHGESANGVRMILQTAKVYIKKEAATAASAIKSGEASTKRINKADAIQELRNAISAVDPALVDEEILDKMTGKAAAYFAAILLTSKG